MPAYKKGQEWNKSKDKLMLNLLFVVVRLQDNSNIGVGNNQIKQLNQKLNQKLHPYKRLNQNQLKKHPIKLG